MSFHYHAVVNKTGFGRVGAGLLRGFDAANLEFQLTPLFGVDLDKDAGDDPSLVATASAQRVDPRAPTLKLFHHHSDLTNWAGRGRRALYTFFEVDLIPPYQVEELNRQTDEVWTASEWGCDVLRTSGYAHEVRTLTPGVDTGVFGPDTPPAQIDGVSPSTFVFLTAGKWSLNKGQDVLRAAFELAFRGDDDVCLVFQCFNPVRAPAFDGPAESSRWAQWVRSGPMGQAGKVLVGETHLPSQRDLAALFARADAGIFPFRGEGFALELFEMAAMGKAVLATAFSAPKEYLGEIGAVGVVADGTEVAYDPPFFPGDAEWARLGPAFIRELSERMRAQYESGRGKVNEQGVRWGQAHSWTRSAETVAGYLEVASLPLDTPAANA
jgi:glycosyltransferase involved in cell wall biosynthesis